MMILKVDSLTKKYGHIIAANAVSFEVLQGQVFGILGPNGSGKTTTLGMILDVVTPNGGTYSWFDAPSGSNQRAHIGSLLETPNFYPHLNAESNLRIAALIKNVSFDNIDAVLQRVNLLERKKSAFRTFSLGMKQRLAIAAALLANPKVLVLDEPTNGLDPQGIIEVRELIHSLANEGKTIIIASHLLDEIEKVCTHVMVMKEGNVLASGKVDEILATSLNRSINNVNEANTIKQTVSAESKIEVAADDVEQLQNKLKELPYIKNIEKRKDLLIVTVTDNIEPALLNQHLFEKGIALQHLSKIKRTLEQQFLEITK